MREILPIHPGEHLAEFLEELQITQYQLAKELRVPQIRISQIVRGKRSITADTALRFAKFFNTSPQYWLNLQANFDLEVAIVRLGTELDSIGTHSLVTN